MRQGTRECAQAVLVDPCLAFLKIPRFMISLPKFLQFLTENQQLDVGGAMEWRVVLLWLLKLENCLKKVPYKHTNGRQTLAKWPSAYFGVPSKQTHSQRGQKTKKHPDVPKNHGAHIGANPRAVGALLQGD